MLGNDFVIKEGNCNLSCSYCLTAQSEFKTDHLRQEIFQPPRRLSCLPGTELHTQMDTVMERTWKHFHPLILKITGGEVMLIEGILEFLAEHATRYATIILQTNGVLIGDKDIDKLKTIGNVVLQLSIDSHIFEGNSYRVNSRSQHERLMERFERTATSGIPVEVYSVLTDKSLPYLASFADYLAELKADIQLCPFPVRGPERGKYFPRPEQSIWLERLLECYPVISSILPPRRYLQRLLQFVRTGLRTHRCFLPKLVFSTFNDGILTPCPNIWFTKVANVLSGDYESELKSVGQGAFYQLLLSDQPRIDACRGCYTPWDVLSLYYGGELTIDEVCRSPIYRHADIRAYLIRQKELLEEARPGKRHLADRAFDIRASLTPCEEENNADN